MPNKKAAEKALRKNIKQRAFNASHRRTFREDLKAARKAVAAGEKSVAELLKKAQISLDKAAKAGVITKNTAARHLSRLHAFAKKGVQVPAKKAAPKKKK